MRAKYSAGRLWWSGNHLVRELLLSCGQTIWSVTVSVKWSENQLVRKLLLSGGQTTRRAENYL
jgi:hypothetical protein